MGYHINEKTCSACYSSETTPGIAMKLQTCIGLGLLLTEIIYITAQGHYVYIEASSPRRPNDTASITTPSIAPTTGACLSFWYHMYGPHINTLNVYMKTGSQSKSVLWTHTGTLADKWYTASVDIMSASASFTLIFEGVRGTSYRGDIALDDITYSYTPCGQKTGIYTYI